jgi:heptosyltransferase-2
MKILLIQTSFLGDTILSTPVISGIHAVHRDSSLWVMTTPLSSDLLRHDPLVNGLITYDKKGKEAGLSGLFAKAAEIKSHGFDLIYSLHRSARTALLVKLSGVRSIGFKQAKMSFLYSNTVKRPLKEHDVIRNLSILSNETDIVALSSDLRVFASPDVELPPVAKKEGYILLVPGSAWKTKMWHWQNYKDVATHFINAGKNIVVAGSGAERKIAEKICQGIAAENLAGKTPIASFIHLVKNASLVICNDSMALHLASAFLTPTVAVFCATSPEFGFGPWKNQRAVVVEKEGLSCKPCARHGAKKCPIGTEACMRELKADGVIEAATGLLSFK